MYLIFSSLLIVKVLVSNARALVNIKALPFYFLGALKQYLRELPEPLMTFDLYDEWIRAIG